jgi:hypothetical protein
VAAEDVKMSEAAKRPGIPTTYAHSLKKSKKGDTAFPDTGVLTDEQDLEIKEIIVNCHADIKKSLQMDEGKTKKSNFVYTREDGKNYLVVPSNLEALMKIKGWNSIFSLLITRGVRLRLSETELENPISSEDVSSFIAGIANRIKTIEENDELTLKVTASDAKNRGRVAVDILLIKQMTKLINVEKYLPETSTMKGRAFMNSYLSLLGGPSGIQTLKNLPDLINTLIKEVGRARQEQIERAVSAFRIPLSCAIDDLVKKKTVTKTEKGKKVSHSSPIHFNRLSNSPFCLGDQEKEFFKAQERAWDTLQKLTEDYKEGIPFDKLTQVREIFSASTEEKSKYTQKYSSWKSRRLEAIKILASTNLSKKQMEAWRLSERTKQEAFDNFPALITEAISSRDRSQLKKVLANLNPNKIPDCRLDMRNSWNNVNADTVLMSLGMVPYYADQNSYDVISNVYDKICLLSAEVSSLATEAAKPIKRRIRRHRNVEDRSPFERMAEDDDEEEEEDPSLDE